jgi:hypothetical protein
MYDVDRRLRILGERLRRCRDPGEVVQQEIEPLCRLPADSVESEFGRGGLAILVMLGRLVVGHSQDAIVAQRVEVVEQFGS